MRVNKLGVATFLPLDTLRPKAVDDALRNLGKKYRLAIEVMQFEDAFFPAMQFACDNAIVCDDMDAARYVCVCACMYGHLCACMYEWDVHACIRAHTHVHASIHTYIHAHACMHRR